MNNFEYWTELEKILNVEEIGDAQIEGVKSIIKRMAGDVGIPLFLSELPPAFMTEDRELILRAIHGIRSNLRTIAWKYSYSSRLWLEYHACK